MQNGHAKGRTHCSCTSLSLSLSLCKGVWAYTEGRRDGDSAEEVAGQVLKRPDDSGRLGGQVQRHRHRHARVPSRLIPPASVPAMPTHSERQSERDSCTRAHTTNTTTNNNNNSSSSNTTILLRACGIRRGAGSAWRTRQTSARAQRRAAPSGQSSPPGMSRHARDVYAGRASAGPLCMARAPATCVCHAAAPPHHIRHPRHGHVTTRVAPHVPQQARLAGDSGSGDGLGTRGRVWAVRQHCEVRVVNQHGRAPATRVHAQARSCQRLVRRLPMPSAIQRGRERE
jgi:hypothetical protein